MAVMSGPPPPLFDRMVERGHASFALAFATNGVEIVTDREKELVDAAVVAGVVGALEVMREDDPDTSDT